MGEIADQLVEQEMFGYAHEGEFKRAVNKKYKRKAFIHLTPVERKIASIRKEIAILVNEQGVKLDLARKMMNDKYGKGWRERVLEGDWSEEDLKDFR